MPSYRFCRTDDLALLAEAYDVCFAPHFADGRWGRRTMGVEDLKRWSRELDLWASSCMVASSDEGPLAVLLAAKRERESLILALGVRPGHERQGHGRHLLESLQQKVTILGPPMLRAEIPSSWLTSRRLFEACGYAVGETYRDFVLERDASPRPSSPLVGAVSVDELHGLGLLDQLPGGLSWRRRDESLRNRSSRLAGLAVVSDVRLEAFALYTDDEDDEDDEEVGGERGAGAGRTVDVENGVAAPTSGERRIWSLYCFDPALQEPMFRLLLGELRRSRPLRLPQVAASEIGTDVLESLGCRPTEATVVYALEAAP